MKNRSREMHQGCLAFVLFYSLIANVTTIRHYEYVFQDGGMFVYDLDNQFALVNHVSIPTFGTRGSVACAGNHQLYISYGSDRSGSGSGHQLAYDLVLNKVLWSRTYNHGIDSQSVRPDCAMIYMPDGELSSDGLWHIETTATGTDVGKIYGPSHPHNTIINPVGSHVYMGGREFNYLEAARTSTDAVYLKVGPLRSSVRPFTINGKETLAFVSVTGLNGFQVVDLETQKVAYTVVQGLSCPAVSDPSHGITISPNEEEIYSLDWCNDQIHVYDIKAVPGAAPRQKAVIKLLHSLHHNESPCAYDCLADGWLHHSHDGRFVFVGDSGDVISTSTHSIIGYLPAMYNSRKEIEIDWANGSVVWAMNNRSSTGQIF